jgi:hypothetical protein
MQIGQWDECDPDNDWSDVDLLGHILEQNIRRQTTNRQKMLTEMAGRCRRARVFAQECLNREDELAEWERERLLREQAWLVEQNSEFCAPYTSFARRRIGREWAWVCSARDPREEDFDGVVADSLGDVKQSYRGMILAISDHGNMTLFERTSRTKTTCLWSAV